MLTVSATTREVFVISVCFFQNCNDQHFSGQNFKKMTFCVTQASLMHYVFIYFIINFDNYNFFKCLLPFKNILLDVPHNFVEWNFPWFLCAIEKKKFLFNENEMMNNIISYFLIIVICTFFFSYMQSFLS